MVSSAYRLEKYRIIDFEVFVTILALRDNQAVLPVYESHFEAAQGRAISTLIGAWSEGFQPPRQARCTR